ncbi:hypothetical protein P879_00098 [Paragonimus westermani]|uniref:Uncharacterized protein n=1 Tax=Paragonimus westermani TaxID=34504 RepID=A0A8T0DW75_9TREM|nr:hypothetical protein P879_00098 [Paragonimus westermani]
MPAEDRVCLRFLNWSECDLKTLWPFGAASSSNHASLALKKTTGGDLDVQDRLSVELPRRAFYVALLRKSALFKGGFPLANSYGNAEDAHTDVPTEDLGLVTVNQDRRHKTAQNPGVVFGGQNEGTRFNVSSWNYRTTRRTIPSYVDSVCEPPPPPDLVAPVLLKARRPFQELCGRKTDWNEEPAQEEISIWEKWLYDPARSPKLRALFHFKPRSLGRLYQTDVHDFPDVLRTGNEKVGI